mgnify:CR=1 FL=1
MSTSNSTNFTVTRDQIISGALRMIGATAQGETPSATQISEAAEALNMLVKAWQADGMPLWGLTEYDMTLVAGQRTYNIGLGQIVNIARPLKIFQMWNTNTSGLIDTPMRILTKQEYNTLGNKESSGIPIQGYYDPQRDYGVLSLFPVPDTNAAANYHVTFIYQRPFEDFDSATDNPDFPQEWFEALKYGLASRLAPEYGLPLEQRQMLNKEMQEIKQAALNFGLEEGSLYFGVERRVW